MSKPPRLIWQINGELWDLWVGEPEDLVRGFRRHEPVLTVYLQDGRWRVSSDLMRMGEILPAEVDTAGSARGCALEMFRIWMANVVDAMVGVETRGYREIAEIAERRQRGGS